MNRNDPEAELILVGGSSVVLNYNFRDATTDIDSIFRATSTIKEIISQIASKEHLSDKWLNDDFKKTASFSHKLVEHSKFYKRFYDCLTVRTVSDEYLLAMKIRSSRDYKHAQSDIIGIIKENYEKNETLSLEKTEKAYRDLYDEDIPQKAKAYLTTVFSSENLEEMYYSVSDMEKANERAIYKADEKYGNIINKDNIDAFLRYDIRSDIINSQISHNEDLEPLLELINEYSCLYKDKDPCKGIHNALNSAEQIANKRQQIEDTITKLVKNGHSISEISELLTTKGNPDTIKRISSILEDVAQKTNPPYQQSLKHDTPSGKT